MPRNGDWGAVPPGPTLRAPTILGEILRTTRSITLAMATTAAIGAFAVLPVSAALASGSHDEDAPSTTTSVTTAPTETGDEVEAGDQDETETGDDHGGSRGDDVRATVAAPHAVKVRAAGSDAVRVTWEVERGAVAATGYTVELRTGPKGPATAVATATEPAGALQHVFTSLDPDTLYAAVVTASYAGGATSAKQSNAVRTDRTAERTVADKAADKAEHEQHAAKKAEKRAAKAAKKAAKLAAHAQRHADKAARKAAKRAAKAARHAAKVAEHAKHRADSAAKRAAKATRMADVADAAETESESEAD